MGKSVIECGGVQCGYDAVHMYGFNLMPPTFQEAILTDDYDYDDETLITCSQYARPVKSIVLEKRGRGKYIQNPDACIDAMLGSEIHKQFELREFKDKGIIKERRFVCNVAGVKTSAKVDLLIPVGKGFYQIADYKTTRTGKTFFSNPEYTLQLSIGRLFAYIDSDIKCIDDGYIFMLFRDWMKQRAEKENIDEKIKYPLSPYASIKVKLMSLDDTTLFVVAKCKEVQELIDAEERDMPKCGGGDYWRCQDYCKGRDICQQYAERLKVMEINKRRKEGLK